MADCTPAGHNPVGNADLSQVSLAGRAGQRSIWCAYIMPQVLVEFERATLDAIDRIAPAASRRRAEFIRQAVKDALFRHEQEKMRRAYHQQPDSIDDADAWELPEAWDA